MWKPKKWTMAKAKGLSNEEIFKMSTQELADLGQYYYQQFHRRVQQGIREGVMPYGVRKMYQDLENARNTIIKTDQGDTPLDQLIGWDLDTPVTRKRGEFVELSETYLVMNRPRNALMSYVFNMRDFFTWKTSTVAGWKRVSRQQDINLFGKDENGNPRYTMNEAERIKFWELYEELKRRGTVDVYVDGRFSEGFINTWLDIAENGAAQTMDITSLIQRMENKLKNPIAFPEYRIGVGENPTQPALEFDENDIWAGDIWGRTGPND